jgi:hypothetical protein
MAMVAAITAVATVTCGSAASAGSYNRNEVFTGWNGPGSGVYGDTSPESGQVTVLVIDSVDNLCPVLVAWNQGAPTVKWWCRGVTIDHNERGSRTHRSGCFASALRSCDEVLDRCSRAPRTSGKP